MVYLTPFQKGQPQQTIDQPWRYIGFDSKFLGPCTTESHKGSQPLTCLLDVEQNQSQQSSRQHWWNFLSARDSEVWYLDEPVTSKTSMSMPFVKLLWRAREWLTRLRSLRNLRPAAKWRIKCWAVISLKRAPGWFLIKRWRSPPRQYSKTMYICLSLRWKIMSVEWKLI